MSLPTSSDMKVRTLLTAGILLMSTLAGYTQTVPVELVYSDKDYRYQHFFFKELKPASRFGFFHTSSMYTFHDEERATEMMSQSYVTYKINPSLTVLAGTFYASIPGFTPSASLQYKYAQKNLFVLVVPRVDLRNNPSYELMSLTEYKPSISKGLYLYSRLQLLSNFQHTTHNRSYQNVRIGVGSEKTQGGFALNYDQYGSEVHKVLSMGVFLRHELGN